MSNPELRVISLGWGLQSWTLAAMVALGELGPVDYAIHSDTTWERSTTYEFSQTWAAWLRERGVKVITVTSEVTRGMVTNEWGGTFIPAFTLRPAHTVISDGWYFGEDEEGESIEIFDPDMVGQEIRIEESRGQLRRQCTERWKIRPIKRFISQELKRRGLAKTPGVVEQWLGITFDEWHRANDSGVKYIKHRHPLLEMDYTRADCLAWLERHGLPNPGKSACVFCPYHSISFWEMMKREGGTDWETAVMVDKRIRDERPPYPLYVHPERKPLTQAVTIPEDFGATQLSFLASNDQDSECDSGFCFL